ncbi:MAG: c-type cytochrome domain-containing protein, partial [Chthoniobacteraceae bacterium]
MPPASSFWKNLLPAGFAFAAVAAAQSASPDFAKSVAAFVEDHCYDCHDADTQKGGFRLDTLSRDLSDPKTAIAWQDLLDLVKQNEMPPKKKSRPPAEELAKF